MASVSAMGVKAAHDRGRRRSSTWSSSDGAAIKAQLTAKKSLSSNNKIESSKNDQQQDRPNFYPGFGKEPPIILKPLMMIDPSHYHHLRRWAIRLIP